MVLTHGLVVVVGCGCSYVLQALFRHHQDRRHITADVAPDNDQSLRSLQRVARAWGRVDRTVPSQAMMEGERMAFA